MRFSLPGFSPLMPRLLCDLERFTNGYRISGPFVSELWLSFEISVTLIAFLDTTSHKHACIFAALSCRWIVRKLVWVPQRNGSRFNWKAGVFPHHQYNLVYPGSHRTQRPVLAVSMANQTEHTVEKGEKRSFHALVSLSTFNFVSDP